MYQCEKCGNSVTLHEGIGFLSVRTELHKESIMDGNHGDRAIRSILEHPDCEVYGWIGIYECSCGNVRDNSNVTILCPDKRRYTPPVKCELCGKRMRRCPSPKTITCMRCGNVMVGFPDVILWD